MARYAFRPIEGGRLQIDFFIVDRSSGVILRGDNRDFSLDPDKESRVRIELNLSKGHAKVTVAKSCLSFSLGGIGCWGAEPVDGGDNEMSITQDGAGGLEIEYDLVNSFTSKLNSGSIDGTISLIPHDGTFNVIVYRNQYPALEITQESHRTISFLVREHSRPVAWAIDNLATYSLNVYENEGW